jgi:predicted DNA-binding helix-hairpin-helix protein
MHLKIIPGASKAAIDEAVSLAKAVSLNIETPGADNLAKVSHKKDYLADIIEPIKYISQLTAKGNRYERVHQTTQFIVGAAGESDRKIVHYMGGLYDRLRMNRVYFSAYQQGLGDAALPAEQTLRDSAMPPCQPNRPCRIPPRCSRANTGCTRWISSCENMVSKIARFYSIQQADYP